MDRLSVTTIYFFEEIFRQADSDQQEHLIICGDWNLSLNPEVDQDNYAVRDRRTKSRNMIQSKCLDLNLHDVWRTMNGDRKTILVEEEKPR